MKTAGWEWVLDVPGDPLKAEALADISLRSTSLVGLSALFSLALAGTLLTEQPEPPWINPFALLGLTWMVYAIGFGAVAWLMFRIAKLFFPAGTFAGKEWLKAGVLALLPLHLALPAALFCKALGSRGLTVYTLMELAIFIAVFRRWVTAVESLTRGPAWASVLIVISPLLLVGVWVFMAAVFLVIVLAVALLGTLG